MAPPASVGNGISSIAPAGEATTAALDLKAGGDAGAGGSSSGSSLEVDGGLADVAALKRPPPPSPPLPLRIVFVSDTHGYEATLTDGGSAVAATVIGVGGAADCGEIGDEIGDEIGATEAARCLPHSLPEGDVLIHCGDFQIGSTLALAQTPTLTLAPTSTLTR